MTVLTLLEYMIQDMLDKLDITDGGMAIERCKEMFLKLK